MATDTTTQSTSPPSWAIPYIQQFMQTSQNVAGMPYNPYQGQTVAALNPYQVQGLNAQAQRAISGSLVMNQASAELQKTLSGNYLNNNPYLSGMVNLANRDVMTSLAPVEARSGSFGNSGVAYTRDRALADSALGIRSGAYESERNRMQNAVGQAPTIANQDYIDANALQQAGYGFQQQQQSQLNDQFQRFQEAQNYPYKQLDTLGKGLGVNTGSTSTMQTPGTSPWATGLGTAATVYSALGQKSPTVICTELHRQGFMDDETFKLDQAYGALLAVEHPEVYAGYIRLATPVVEKMQRSRVFTQFVWLLAKPWAQEMAREMGSKKGSLVGRAIMKFGYPLCRLVAKRGVVYG